MSRRSFLRGLGMAGLVAAGAAAESVREVYAFQTNRHVRRIRGLLAPLRVSLLTDFHIGPYLHASNLEAWVRSSNDLAPDLVLVCGDVVDRFYRGDLSEVTAAMKRLRARLGVIAVPGNHDRVRYPDLRPLRRSIERAQGSYLVNEGRWIRDDVFLAGVDDLREGDLDVVAAMQGSEMREGARILLSHNPDVIPGLRPGPDLVLCGHTHGGQVCLPLVGPLVTSSVYGSRYVSGWVPTPATMSAFVSRGLGVTLVPLRLDCPPEVVCLDLLPA